MPDKDEHPEHPSTPIGQYYLLDKIAQGGMAEIFKGLAYDLHGIKKTVVIKKILPEIAADPEFIQMLINEAKIAVMLSHGNIAQIYDLGKVGNDYFMVMEYVDGKSLSKINKRALTKGDYLPVEYACYFIAEVANGLNYMHRRTDEGGRNLGIIHRDISPQNVIISYSGTVKIIDFGIAKASAHIHITDSGVLKGKFAYMSPEQAMGEMVDHRTDIFSLGVILYELLTGRRLFKGKSKKETLQNVRRCSVKAPSEVRKDLPPELDSIVMKALTKDPKNRYMWAGDLNDDLVKFIYRNYPDFQPSSIINYIRKLFEDEEKDMEDAEEEAKTPFLIIDHTQSAILAENMDATGLTKVPPQLKDFMLEETTPVEKMEIDKEITKKKPAYLNRFSSAFRRQAVLAMTMVRSMKKNWRTTAAVSTCLLTLFIALYTVAINLNIVETPRLWGWLKPRTILIIDVNPPDAEVTFGNIKLEGKSPYRIKNIRPGENYRLIIEQQNYASYFHSVSLNKGEKRRLNIILQPEPPHYATLTITSTPPGASIFLNEKDTSLKTPAEVSYLKPAVYYGIGLHLDGYKFWGRDLRLGPDETKKLHANLVISYGELLIISTPGGADVSIDGKAAGKTPLAVKKLKPGDIIEVIVSKKGFVEWSGKTKIKPDARTTLTPKLARTKEYLVPDFLRDLDKPRHEEAPPGAHEMLPPAPMN